MVQFMVVLSEVQNWKWIISPKLDPPVRTGFGLNFAALRFTLHVEDNVAIERGARSATDPSELDVPLILNGKRRTIAFHIVDLPPAFSYPVGPAADVASYPFSDGPRQSWGMTDMPQWSGGRLEY
jgi:hypothetical protein